MDLLNKLGIETKEEKLYNRAFTHTSYANENNCESYERLEYLVDAVLELIMSEYLYKNTEYKEGMMTKLRSHYVCENALYEYSKRIGLNEYLRLGHGEYESGGQERKEIDFFSDYKSILQELVQTDKRSLEYVLVSESGPAHNKEFTIEVRIDDMIYGVGTAHSKKEAEQLAAKDALKKAQNNEGAL